MITFIFISQGPTFPADLFCPVKAFVNAAMAVSLHSVGSNGASHCHQKRFHVSTPKSCITWESTKSLQFLVLLLYLLECQSQLWVNWIFLSFPFPCFCSFPLFSHSVRKVVISWMSCMALWVSCSGFVGSKSKQSVGFPVCTETTKNWDFPRTPLSTGGNWSASRTMGRVAFLLHFSSFTLLLFLPIFPCI